MDEKIITDIKTALDEIKTGHKSLAEEAQANKKALETIEQQQRELRRGLLVRQDARQRGMLSEGAAQQLGMHLIECLAGKGQLDYACNGKSEVARRHLADLEAHKKALSATEFPLPIQYYGQINELIAEYGVAMAGMTAWPLSGGTDKPPRSKTGFEFGFTGAGVQMTEKSPAIEYASLESHKAGGIIYLPREVMEQSAVAIGQYLAVMAAVRFAWIEDKSAFLGDGSATYDSSIKGVHQIAIDNSKVVTLGAGKTATGDIGVADFRSVLAKVNSRVLATGKWYMNPTWRSALPDFNSEKNQFVYRELGDGTSLFFGRPVVWTEVLAAYSSSASASACGAVFGDLKWWWLGKRNNGPRIDVSEQFKFDYDLISVRMIEEFDVDYMATDAAASVRTAAA